jgi:hypothetical protein
LALCTFIFAGAAICTISVGIDAFAIAIGQSFLTGGGANTIGADFTRLAEVVTFATMIAIIL